MDTEFDPKEMRKVVKAFLGRENLQCHLVKRACNYSFDSETYRIHHRKPPIPSYGRYDLRESIVQILSEDPCEPLMRSEAFRAWLGHELAAYKRELEGKTIALPGTEPNVAELMLVAMGGSDQQDNERGTSPREYALGNWCKANLTKEVVGVSLLVSSVTLTDAEVEMLYIGITQVQEMVEENLAAAQNPVKAISYGKGLRVTPVRKSKTNSSEIAFEPALVNTSPTAEKFIERLEAIASKPKNEQPSSITCLFHGAPGTSKTALGHHLADSLGKPLLKKTFADIQDKYVGEGEKKLAGVFEEARASKSILLIDEVDSLAANRFTAEKEHVKTMTNQLLTCLDDHEGIVICTTNFLGSLDPAVLRRFFLKMQFSYLTKDQQALALKRFFPRRFRNKALPEMQYLTTGDFKVVKERAMYEPTIPTFERVVEMLKDEVKVKIKTTPELYQSTKRSIGFHT
jgi:hypothetical protein